jgi:hypothetical protein
MKKKIALAGILGVLAFSTKAESIDTVDTSVEASEESSGSYALTSSGVRILVGASQRFLQNARCFGGTVGLGYTLPAHERVHPGIIVGVDFAKSKKATFYNNGEEVGSIKNRGTVAFVNFITLFPVRHGVAPYVQLGWRFQKVGSPTLGLGLQKQFTKMFAIQGGGDWVFKSKKETFSDNVTRKAGRGLIAHICAVLTPRNHSF